MHSACHARSLPALIRIIMSRLSLSLCWTALALLTVGAAITLADDERDAPDVDAVAGLLEFVIEADETSARDCLAILTRSVQSGELDAEEKTALRRRLDACLGEIVRDLSNPLRMDAALLVASWSDPEGIRIARGMFTDTTESREARLSALRALIAAGDATVLEEVADVLDDSGSGSVEFRGSVVSSLGDLEHRDVAALMLWKWDGLEPELQPRALELLTQRPMWAGPLLDAIVKQQVPKDALNLNQLRRIALFEDAELQAQFQSIYGTLREGRDPQREQYVQSMRELLEQTPGDPHNGVLVFKKICAQCHKIHGEGAEVGPDITLNGRNNWDQLLSNVFDPSLVIGPGYQARQLVTFDGRVLTGLPVEESDQRVILKMQGGKTETIPRDEIDIYETSEVSLMPEELEKQLSPQEIADLMSFLALDKPPSDPAAKRLSGAPAAR